MAQPPVAESDLVATVVRLCRALRERSIAVTPGESIDAVRTLTHVDLGDREDVRIALRAVLISRREDYDAFDAAFDEAWQRRGGTQSPIPMPKVRTEVKRPPPQSAGRAKPAPVSLQNWMKPNEASDSEELRIRAASDREALSERDFSDYAADDDEAFRRLAKRFARRLALRKSRRWKAARRGERLDFRRTVRSSLRTGGNAMRLERRTRRLRRTRLLALCDVSGSMELYSRFLLQFLHSLQNTFARVETFVFSTRLSRITDRLRGVHYRESLRNLGREVHDWAGGTRIGSAVRSLLDEHGGLIDRRTIVLVMSDGWDVGDPAILADAMRDLRRRAGRVIWLNPLMGAVGFSPETRGMQAALPYIDLLAPGHNLASLEGILRELVV